MEIERTKMVNLEAASGWQVAATEKSYLQVKSLLRSFVAEMQKALINEDKYYRENLDKENQNYDLQIQQLKKALLEDPNSEAQSEFSNLCASSECIMDNTDLEMNASLEAWKVHFREEPLLMKFASFLVAKKDADLLGQFAVRADRLAEMEHRIREARGEVCRKSEALCNAKIRMNNKHLEQQKEQETKAHQLRINNITHEHTNTVAMLVNNFEGEFSRYFNTTAFATAYDMVNTRMRAAAGYTCSDKIPEAMYLGKRTFTISSGKVSFMPEVQNMFRRIEHNAVSVSNHEIRIELPFFRSIEEGYSVYLEVRDASTRDNNKIVWDYIMKTLMNFPAGQTRPLLLDCDSTTELTDFRVIGDSSGRNMVTKPWTDAKDIETELKKLAVEHSNLTISYGKDVASRMLREPVYMVACRNFPKDISVEAMASMSNIISAGSSRGFFGILQASVPELANFKKIGGINTLLDSIKKASFCVRETDYGYVVQDASGEDVFKFEQLPDVEAYKRDILSHLINGVARYRRQVEKFEYLFSKDAGNIEGMDMHNINTWYRGDASNRLEVPIGISGASTVQKYAIGGVAQHGLISGVTGSGKSTLLKTIIIASMMKYTPDNLNLYLIDFKEGVEFAAFSEYHLPWIKTIALNTQRIFALNILKELESEFKRRADDMRQNSVKHIKEVKQRYPRILLVFDEVQELLRIDDDITRDCINILSGLVSEGRAMNINVIMASQNFAVCRGVDSLKANMVIRIALKGSPESAKIVMGSDFSVDQLEQGDSGSAAINMASGTRGQTTFFQVGYLEDDEMKDLLSKLSMTMRFRKANTRIMAVHANQDRNSKFNRLITDGELTACEDPDNYELMLGDEFIINRKRDISIGIREGENLMLVGESEATAKPVFALSILSALYGQLASGKNFVDGEIIRLVDMSDEYSEDAGYLHDMSTVFDRQIKRVDAYDVRNLIDDTYRLLNERKRGNADKNKRLFLMIFGLDSLQSLRKEMFSEDDELSLNKKLLRLIQEGPKNGINCILWARSLDGFQEVVDSVSMNKYFNKRIYFGESEDAKKILGMKFDMSKVTDKTVAYRDVSKAVPSTFRVFELPNSRWVERIAEAYRDFYHKK